MTSAHSVISYTLLVAAFHSNGPAHFKTIMYTYVYFKMHPITLMKAPLDDVTTLN